MFRRYRRRSARVLLLDPDDRVLLLRTTLDASDPAAGHYWLTPGGGVHRGESLAQAAARELGEETGVTVTPRELGSPVAFTAGYAAFSWAKGTFRDDFFVHRTTVTEVDSSRMEEFESGNHAGHHWWTRAELAATNETIHPWALADLLADLLAGTLPAAPRRLPWHH